MKYSKIILPLVLSATSLFAGHGGGVNAGAGSTLLNGLKVYYTLSDLTDSSGNGLTLTDHGTVPFAAGKVGNAATFVSASSQYLTHADNAALQMGTGNFSLAAWVKFTDAGASKTIFQYGAASGSTGYAFFTANGFVYAYMLGTSGPAVNINTTSCNDNSWHLIVATFDRAGLLSIYLDNGAATTTDLTVAIGSVNNTNGWGIGGRYDGAQLGDLSVDELGVWNRILTSTEITNLRNGGAGTTHPFTGL
jgi:Concanavalin A-like lectin/glucanases superfamily